MGYQKRHPIRDILDLQDRMNRVFEESFRDSEHVRLPGRWNPQVDVAEDDEALYIRAETPRCEAGGHQFGSFRRRAHHQRQQALHPR